MQIQCRRLSGIARAVSSFTVDPRKVIAHKTNRRLQINQIVALSMTECIVRLNSRITVLFFVEAFYELLFCSNVEVTDRAAEEVFT